MDSFGMQWTTPLRRFVEVNRRICRWERSILERSASGAMRTGRNFRDRVIPELLKPGLQVLDVGGGKHPVVSLGAKQKLGLTVFGLDISDAELRQAPRGCYDEWIVGDVAVTAIPKQFDLVVSRSVLEHVHNPRAALANMAGALTPGGTMVHLVPCRNAPFAMIRRMVSDRAARKILFALFPEKAETSGFTTYYHECTPARIARICQDCGLDVVQVIPYYRSEYASFFAPLYTIELLRQLIFSAMALRELAEVFTVIARRPDRLCELGGGGTPCRPNNSQRGRS